MPLVGSPGPHESGLTPDEVNVLRAKEVERAKRLAEPGRRSEEKAAWPAAVSPHGRSVLRENRQVATLVGAVAGFRLDVEMVR